MKLKKLNVTTYLVILNTGDLQKIGLNADKLYMNEEEEIGITEYFQFAVQQIVDALGLTPYLSDIETDVRMYRDIQKINFMLRSKQFRPEGTLANIEEIINRGWCKSVAKGSSIIEGENTVGELTETKKVTKSKLNTSRIGEKQNFYYDIVPTQLSTYLTDLTVKVQKNNVEVFNRDNEINRVLEVLQRKRKRNACLIGEAGVGKTTIVEGLATKFTKNEVAKDMQGKHILELNISAMLAGSKYRGDFEKKAEDCLKFVESRNDCILFIDELHQILGAGGAEGAMDMASIIKPTLTKDKFQIIGATTYADYKATIEKDTALARRFQRIAVVEPTAVQTIDILNKAKASYEEYHHVKVPAERVKEIIRLADRYMSDRNFPDKAFDILDEACVKAKRNDQKSITSDNIMEVVATISRIPITKLKESDTERLMQLEEHLNANVLGQQEAIKSVTRAIKRNRVGISEGTRPIGSFLFVGSTGTGKTELAKALSREWFGTEKALIKIDMSEYMESHSVSKLIGAPAGYVGFEEGGALTQKIKTQPYSVVLFDEVEKAHKDVLNLLLQLLDEGALTDAYSGRVDFRNTIIILTSNIGATDVSTVKSIGFASNEAEKREDTYKKAVQSYFKPELLNRIDSVIYFNDLETNVIENITDKLLNELKDRVSKIGYTITFTDDVKSYLVKGGYSKKYGVRELKRYIATTVESKVADTLIEGVKKKAKIQVECIDGEVKVNIVTEEKPINN